MQVGKYKLQTRATATGGIAHAATFILKKTSVKGRKTKK